MHSLFATARGQVPDMFAGVTEMVQGKVNKAGSARRPKSKNSSSSCLSSAGSKETDHV